MKFLLLLALFGVLWWVWPKRAAMPPPVRPDPPVERMVACAHCGLLLPESDSIGDGERHYCSEAHHREGEA
ncbi:MAG: hypothetical protein LBE81_14405 [Azonexus sp.]|jgi:uncharacterized protein|uniref:PP0621 family protein n=1 Tax=Azonexus sp. TaxID=1872668 RepID=UPI0028287C14|nr:PP0621 family protein [Azonexus sp.]MDR0777805.1 hypothetical protein [Azonexus sp.]